MGAAVCLTIALIPAGIVVMWCGFGVSGSWLHIALQFTFWGHYYIMILRPKAQIDRDEDIVLEQAMSMREQGSVEELQIDVEGHWKQAIGTKRGYDSFATFLASQFSLENLLFITEFVQLKRMMM